MCIRDRYKCTIVFNDTINQGRIAGLQGDSDFTGTSGSIYIQDAQLEQGLVARDYIETTTAAVEGGITDNVPRLDYTDSSCPSLLLEPSRTNILEYSEYLDGVPYKSRVNITNNAIVSPEGVQNAAKVIPTSVSGTHALDYIPSVVVSDYTMSVYAKAGEYSKFLLLTNNRGSNEAIGFDLSDASTFVNDLGYATPSADAVSIEAVGNGWYRCSMKYAKDSTGGSGNGIYLVNDAEQTTFVGNDSDGIYFWGWQMEAGSYQTSYIPTYGTSVTRNNDETDVTGLQSKGILSSTQGTMFFHITDIEGTAVVFNAQTANDLSYALRFIARDNGFQTFQRVNDVQTTIRGTSSLTLSEWKIAMSWNGTNLITSLNGTSYIDTIDASIASQLDAVKRVNPQAIYVTTNQILVFPTQLTEAELNDLTTL